MREGKIIADGEAKNILTNPDILNAASIVPPQIAQIFLELADQMPNLKLPKTIIDLYEAREAILKIMESRAE
jgi:hypothetical protein